MLSTATYECRHFLDSYEDNHKFVCLDDTFNATPYFLMNLLVGVRWACIQIFINLALIVFRPCSKHSLQLWLFPLFGVQCLSRFIKASRTKSCDCWGCENKFICTPMNILSLLLYNFCTVWKYKQYKLYSCESQTKIATVQLYTSDQLYVYLIRK